jgi:hypothetical protein
MLKVIIAGGRDFNDYPTLKKYCDHLLQYKKEGGVIIVSGKANGADSLGEQYAKENNFPVANFPADWKTHGKAAGFIRNIEMAKYADALIAFWDQKSNGTKHMIATAQQESIYYRIHHY